MKDAFLKKKSPRFALPRGVGNGCPETGGAQGLGPSQSPASSSGTVLALNMGSAQQEFTDSIQAGGGRGRKEGLSSAGGMGGACPHSASTDHGPNMRQPLARQQ